MRLLVTGGGTGGHVYPALSVLEALADDGASPKRTPTESPSSKILWVGKLGGMEEPILRRANIPYQAIAAGGLRDTAWSRRALNVVLLTRGFGAAWQVVRGFRPDVVFATGGYVTFPVGLAARAQGVPILVYLPDIQPGWAVRALAPLAREVAITVPETARWFGEKAVVTGYPVRAALGQPRSRAAARATFGLPLDAKVLLVTGGSSGAHSLNEAVGHSLEGLLEVAWVIHVHGKSDGAWLKGLRDALPATLRDRYHLHDYLHETMPDALLAADLVVARAGASVLGEFPAAGLPAILVPLPITGVQQADNARWLRERGGAVVLDDARVRSELLPQVCALLTDPERLGALAAAMRGAAHPDAAARIAARLRALGTQSVERRTQNDSTNRRMAGGGVAGEQVDLKGEDG